MGRKNNKNIHQPNAPELQQILLQSPSIPQPPHNPYYPDLGSQPPPPYSQTPTGQLAAFQMSRPGQAQPSFNNLYPRQQLSPTVIVQQRPSLYIDGRAEKRHRKMKKFNTELGIMALITIALALYAYKLYDYRDCIYPSTILKPAKDAEITLADVRNMHKIVAYCGVFVFLICLAKCATGRSHSYGCYLFVVSLSALIISLITGYLAYLAFYSPCVPKIGEVISSAAKTIGAKIFDELPSPDRKIFGESNILDMAKDDTWGLYIFIIDCINFIMYVSIFLGSLCSC